jgi:uncharacterized membrane protein
MTEIINWIWQHRNEPLTWGLIGSFILLVIDRFGRKLINDQLKRLFKIQDKTEFKEFSKNQRVIMENQRRMMRHLGVEPCAENDILKPYGEKTSSKFLGIFPARHATPFTRERMIWMQEKLKSRKFWVAIIGALLVVINDQLELGLDTESLMGIVGIAITYIIGQSAVDATKRKEKSDAQSHINDDEFV